MVQYPIDASFLDYLYGKVTVNKAFKLVESRSLFMAGNLLQAQCCGRRTGHKENYLFFKLFHLFSIPHYLLVIIINYGIDVSGGKGYIINYDNEKDWINSSKQKQLINQ